MTAHFRCPACGGEHPTRLRAPMGETLPAMIREVGSILEPCPRTRDWVRIGPAELTAAAGDAARETR